MGEPAQRRQQKRSSSGVTGGKESSIWFRKPDAYRRLKRPSIGPAAPPVCEGAHVAAQAISVGEFATEATEVLRLLGEQLDAACGPAPTAEEEASLDVRHLRLRQLPNPQDELSFLQSIEQQELEQQQEGGVIVAGTMQQGPAAATSEGGARGAARGASPAVVAVGQQQQQQRRGRHPEGSVFKAAARRQQEERARAAQLLHSAKEALEGGPALKPTAAAAPPTNRGQRAGAPADGAAVADVTAAVAAGGADSVLVTVVVCEARRNHKNILIELQLPDSSTLADLRDAIRCPTDALAASAGAAAPSSYFHIAGRFYYDGRDPAACDPSGPISEFCESAAVTAPLHLLAVGGAAPATGGQQQKQQQGQQQQQQQGAGGEQQEQAAAGSTQSGPAAPSARMEDTCLADLSLAPASRPTYLFCHQGCCEHAWFVSDIRLRTAADPSGPTAYPRALFRAAPAARCGICERERAVAVVGGHPAAPEDPCLLCAVCRGLLVGPSDGSSGSGTGTYKLYSLV